MLLPFGTLCNFTDLKPDGRVNLPETVSCFHSPKTPAFYHLSRISLLADFIEFCPGLFHTPDIPSLYHLPEAPGLAHFPDTPEYIPSISTPCVFSCAIILSHLPDIPGFLALLTLMELSMCVDAGCRRLFWASSLFIYYDSPFLTIVVYLKALLNIMIKKSIF